MTLRSRPLASVTRAAIAILILVAATAIALTSRSESTSPQAGAGGKPDASHPRESVMGSEAKLEPLRRRAELRPCPKAEPGQQGEGPLSGIVVPCLGEPGSVDLAAALAGQHVLLNVWASWCPPCREEVPALEKYTTRKGSIPVVGIDIKDRATDALRLMIESEAHYPSVVDVDGKLQRALNVPPVIPLTYMLYPDGSVRRIPAVFESADQVADAVRRYLEKPPK